MRVARFSAVVVIAAAAAEACSLFIPFDDYPGATGATTHDSGPGDVRPDGTTPDAGDEDAYVPPECIGVDFKIDSKHCGACNRVCAAGECVNGRCPVEPLQADVAGPIRSLYFEDTPDIGETVYYTRAPGQLGRVVLDGGATEIAPATNAVGAVSINSGGRYGVFGAKNGAWTFKTNTFVTGAAERIFVRQNVGPVTHGGALTYFGDDAGMGWSETRADAVVTTVTTSPPVAFTLRAGSIYWAAVSGEVFTMRAASPLTPALVVSTARPNLTSIAVATGWLYVGQPSQGLAVYTHDPATTSATFSRLVPLDDVEAITTDGEHVYAMDVPRAGVNGRIIRTNLDGTGMIVLADKIPESRAIAVAGKYVYFGNGAILSRTSK